MGIRLSGNQLTFWTFQYFNFEIDFLENDNLFQKTGVPFFRLRTHHFNTKLLYQKPVLRQIKWWASTKWTYHKERSFASNHFIFLNFFSSLRTSFKELNWCTNDPDTHIPTFRKLWSFFPVSLLNMI